MLVVTFVEVGTISLDLDYGYGNRSRISNPVWECVVCGAVVTSRETHKTWHEGGTYE